MKLLNPGPVTLTARVRASLQKDDLCHREPEFATLTKSVMQKLARVYPASESAYVPVLITGSGTGAVEAMLGSLVPKATQSDKKTLVVANGVYGDRAAAMLTAQGKPFEIVSSAWTAPMDLEAVEKAMATGAYGHVVAVHHETTTGRLNDIAALGKLCVKYKVPMLLDGVSSFAGEDIRFEEWNLEAVAATANKCIHGVPGIAFVVVKKDVFTTRQSGATSVYLDLFRYEKEQRSGFSPFTQSVQAMYALDEALSELADQGGAEARTKLYAHRSKTIREGLFALGIETFLGDASVYGTTLTSFRLPQNLAYEKLHKAMKDNGFIIYAGQGPFQGQLFRIAVMGDLTNADLEAVVGIVRSSLA